MIHNELVHILDISPTSELRSSLGKQCSRNIHLQYSGLPPGYVRHTCPYQPVESEILSRMTTAFNLKSTKVFQSCITGPTHLQHICIPLIHHLVMEIVPRWWLPYMMELLVCFCIPAHYAPKMCRLCMPLIGKPCNKMKGRKRNTMIKISEGKN